MIYRTAAFQVRADEVEACLAAVRAFVAYVQEQEPATRLYEALQSREEPTAFLHLMAFEDEAAEQTHRTSAAVARFMEVLHPLTVDGVAFTEYRAVL
jgi:quinol monooxygenase YgiN